MIRARWLRPLLCVALLLPAGAALADAGPTLFAQCIACHGRKAEGMTSTGAPAIAGQDAAYLQRQLQAFRSGLRGTNPKDTYGAQMRAIALTLRDEAAVAAVAKYVAGLPRTTASGPAKADLRNGNNLYHGKCGACHGGKAEGNAALKAPRLAGLDTAYLQRQFNHFRDGVRGADPKDTTGRQMAMMAKTLPKDSDLQDVIAFIHAQGNGK
jgi:cytochrome c oxidase subunit 2